jgi:transposase
MEELSVVGLDLAKNVMQVHGMDARGRKCFGRQIRRSEVMGFFAKLPSVLVGIEACSGAHHWARRIERLGHRVKLMAPHHVKPYLRGNKTDARDAAAIAEAAARESVPAVAIRSVESQQLQALHRVREEWMKQRTATSNQIRSLLGEFGETIPQGYKRLREHVALWYEGADESWTMLKGMIEQQMNHLRLLEQWIAALELQIKQQHQVNPASRLIESIPGVGVLTASAAAASVGRGEQFPSARHLASWIGLTPREHSSGGKQVLLGISKRGNCYLRKLLVQGACSVLKVRMNQSAYAEDWAVRLAHRRGHQVAAVALAAKNARRIWAMLRSGEVFRSEHLPHGAESCA